MPKQNWTRRRRRRAGLVNAWSDRQGNRLARFELLEPRNLLAVAGTADSTPALTLPPTSTIQQLPAAWHSQPILTTLQAELTTVINAPAALRAPAIATAQAAPVATVFDDDGMFGFQMAPGGGSGWLPPQQGSNVPGKPSLDNKQPGGDKGHKTSQQSDVENGRVSAAATDAIMGTMAGSDWSGEIYDEAIAVLAMAG